jgi:type II secretory ATPase GspE/PulE/Tfp pilus assembly ATPase PilB-like protein
MEQREQNTSEVQPYSQKKTRVGEILMEYGLVTSEQLDVALTESKETGKRLGEVLIDLGFVTEDQMNWALSYHLNIPLIESLDLTTLDLDLIRSIPEEVLLMHTVLPLAILDDEIAVVMADPTDSRAIEQLEVITGRRVRPSITSSRHISVTFSQLFAPPEEAYQLEPDETEFIKVPSTQLDPLKGENYWGISFLNFHLTQAILENADEIHIDPLDGVLWVRHRVNGILKHKSMESMAYHEPIIRQLRAMGKLRTLEMVLQKADVKIQLKDLEFYLKIFIFPTLRGEAVWIKILKEPPNAEENQLSQLVTPIIKKFPSRPKGLFLMTSPFVTERTRMLSMLIRQLESPGRKIIILERKSTLSSYGGTHIVLDQSGEFSNQQIFEELLSQNPEIVILSEPEAFSELLTPALWEAASSSTLIIGTLTHKNSGAAVEDLMQRVKPMVLGSVLRYILAGNKFKKLCTGCQEAYTPSSETLSLLNLPANTHLYRSKGCDQCASTGINGELTLYELVEIDEELQASLQSGLSTQVKEVLSKRLEPSIQKQIVQKLGEGTLSAEEAILKIFN